METIDIALAADAAYFPGLLVTAVSLARHASRERSLRINVLDGGIGAENREFLERKLAEAHAACTVRYFDIDDRRFAAYPAWNGNGRMAYARLLLPDLVTDADWLVYCDVDFLWLADVAELWKLRDPTRVLQARRDAVGTFLLKAEDEWYRARGIEVDMDDYVCTGLMIVNLAEFRRRQIARTIFGFLGEHPDVLFVDQSAINAVVREKGFLDERWGAFSRWLSDADFHRSLAVHYSGCAPWCGGRWNKVIYGVDRHWYAFYAELCGIGEWTARFRLLGVCDYFKRRLVYLLVTLPLVREFTFLALRVLGRGCYIPYFKELCPVKR